MLSTAKINISFELFLQAMWTVWLAYALKSILLLFHPVADSPGTVSKTVDKAATLESVVDNLISYPSGKEASNAPTFVAGVWPSTLCKVQVESGVVPLKSSEKIGCALAENASKIEPTKSSLIFIHNSFKIFERPI